MQNSFPSESKPCPSESEPCSSESEPFPSESESYSSESEPFPSESESYSSESEPFPSESESLPSESESGRDHYMRIPQNYIRIPHTTLRKNPPDYIKKSPITCLKFIFLFQFHQLQNSSNFQTLHLFSYVLITKHTNNHNTCNMVYTPFIKHSHDYTSFTKQSPKTHACSVLVWSRDFLGNLIPKLNIEPHLVVMFLHDYGLSPSPHSLGFHIPILHIKPPSGDGYPNPSSLGIRIPKL